MTNRIPQTGEQQLRRLYKDVQWLMRQGDANAAVTLKALGDEIGAIETAEALTPAAPIELVTTTELYIERGTQYARIYLNFPDVEVSTDAQPIEVDGYEMQAKITGAESFGLVDTSSLSSLAADRLTPGVSYTVRARAVGYKNVGLWSAEVVVVTEADDTPPGPPTTPVGRERLGVAHFYWDGTFGAGAQEPPADLDRVEAEISLNDGPFQPTDQFSLTATTFTFANYDDGDAVACRLVAYDYSGNASAPSGVAQVTLNGIVDEDLIEQSILDAIAAAQEAAEAAQSSAGGGYFAQSPPGATTAPLGAIWYELDPDSGDFKTVWQQTAANEDNVGNVWVARDLVPSLDVGKLTAAQASVVDAEVLNLLRTKILVVGAIDDPVIIADGVVTARTVVASEEMSAKLAQFLKVTTEQLEADSVTSTELAAGAVQAENIALSAVLPEKMATNGEELLPNPKWLYPQSRTDWPLNPGFTYVTNPVTPAGQTHVVTSINGSNGDSAPVGPLQRTVPGEMFYLEQLTRANGNPGHVHRLGLSVQDLQGNEIAFLSTNATVETYGSWVEYSTVVKMPENAVAVVPHLRIFGSNFNNNLWTASVSLRRVMASGQDAADPRQQVQLSPMGGKFGDPEGEHSTLTWAGLQVFSGPDDADGSPVPVTRIGQFDEEVVSVVGIDGQVVAAMSNTGEVSGEVLSAREDLVVDGRRVLGPFVQDPNEDPDTDSYFWELPWGNVVWADLKEVATTLSTSVPGGASSAELGIAHVDVDFIPGRAYEITLKTGTVDIYEYSPTARYGGGLGLTYTSTTNGSEPLNPTPEDERLTVVNIWPKGTDNALTIYGDTPPMEAVYTTDVPVRAKLLVFLRAWGSGTRVEMGAQADEFAWQLLVNDVGPRKPGTAVKNHSTGNGIRINSATKKTFTTYWEPSEWRSYQNGVRSDPSGGNNDRIGQGSRDWWGSGDRDGYLRFAGGATGGDEQGKTITQALSGASNIRVRVRLGNARSVEPAVHAHIGWTSSWNGAQAGERISYYIPRGDTRYTTLPIGSWLKQSSSNRYIMTGGPNSSGEDDYAEWWAQGYGPRKDARLEITYTKTL